jgi:hypothetical protein
LCYIIYRDQSLGHYHNIITGRFSTTTRIELNIRYLAINPTKLRRNKPDTFPTNSLLQTQNTGRKRNTNIILATFTTKIQNRNSSEIILKDDNTSNYTRRTILLKVVKSIIY